MTSRAIPSCSTSVRLPRDHVLRADSGLPRGLSRLLHVAECGPQPAQRSRADAAHARFGEADLHADLTQRETAAVRENDHATFQLRERAELARHAVPAWVVADIRGYRVRLRDGGVAQLCQPVEGDLHVRRREILGDLLRLAVCPARGAGEWVALAQCVKHLAAHSAGRVRAEGRADFAAVALRGLDKPNDASRDQVFAVGAAAPRIERAGSDGPREAQVREDAFVYARRARAHRAEP